MAASSSSGVHPATPHELYMASVKLIGNTTVAGAFYGIMTVIAAACAQTLVRFRKRQTRRRLAFLLAYVAVLWLCGTLFVAGLALSTQTTYIDHRLFTPGPFAYYRYDQPGMLMTALTYFIANVLAEATMVRRFKVIWGDSPYYRWLVPIPSLLWVANAAVGLTEYVFIAIPQHALYAEMSQRIVVPNLVLTAALNVFATALIAGRLLVFRRRIKKQHEAPGSPTPTPAPKTHTSTTALLAESCAPYTACSVLLLALGAAAHPAASVLAAVTAQMQIIAPLLVVLRVARGTAWCDKTAAEISASQRERDAEGQFGGGGDGGEESSAHGKDGSSAGGSSGGGSELDSPRLPRMLEKPSASSITFSSKHEHELDDVDYSG